jgi:DNA repair exonuclease SbcCD ATPase subunit
MPPQVGIHHSGAVVIRDAPLLKQGAKAILIALCGREIWIPNSQIEAMSHKAGGSVDLRVTDWIAQQKGLLTPEGKLAEWAAGTQVVGESAPTLVQIQQQLRDETCATCGYNPLRKAEEIFEMQLQVDRANQAVENARREVESARKSQSEADRRTNDVRQAKDAAEREVARLQGEMMQLRREVAQADALRQKIQELQRKLDAAEQAVAAIGRQPEADYTGRFQALEVDEI